MKKYMQTAGANPVPFQEIETLTEEVWAKLEDLTPYIGKTLITEKGDAAHYVLDGKSYVDLTIIQLGGGK